MGDRILHSRGVGLWPLVERQHGVVTRAQLLEAGYSAKAVKHRVARGRLHRVMQGVYAVGRPELTQHGRWMAAVLSCGPEAVLSHESAAALWDLRPPRHGRVHVSVPAHVARRPRGVAVHRLAAIGPGYVTRRHRIAVTTPIVTLVDTATCVERAALETAVSEADKLGLTDPEGLRSALDRLGRRPGVKALRELLDRRTFVLTDSALERRFLPLARAAGLPLPETRRYVNGFRVDFYWPELGLVVETDGLRYHRTPVQQARDRVRDQAHTAAGLTPLRFTHAQVAYERTHVRATLVAVAGRLRGGSR